MDFDREKLKKVKDNPCELEKLIINKDEDLLCYLKNFRHKNENIDIGKKGYDVGIYTVGLSPYTILLSLSVTQPKEKAIFYYTEKSLRYKPIFEIFSTTFDMKFQLIHEVMKSSSDTAEMYNCMEKAIKENKNKKIAIDITGGKKPTIAAGFLGASLYKKENNIDILYVDFEEYKDDNPLYGSEYLTILLNPNDLFSTVERKALKELFQAHQYRGARKLSKDIINRLKHISKIYSDYNIDYQINELERIYFFSKLYEMRNDFNYYQCQIDNSLLTDKEIKGLKALLDAKKRIDKLSMELPVYKQDKNYNYLVCQSIYEEFKNDDSLIYLALERYIGALRYKSIDYQSYILRLASVIELSGIIMYEGKYSNLNEKIKYINSSNLRNQLFGLKNERNNLSLTHGFGFLDTPKEGYESAVIEYVCMAFKKSRKEVDNIIEELKFRTFDEVLHGL